MSKVIKNGPAFLSESILLILPEGLALSSDVLHFKTESG
jgi:hypothetical protein